MPDPRDSYVVVVAPVAADIALTVMPCHDSVFVVVPPNAGGIRIPN